MKLLKRVVLHLPRVQRRIVIQRESYGAEAVRRRRSEKLIEERNALAFQEIHSSSRSKEEPVRSCKLNANKLRPARSGECVDDLSVPIRLERQDRLSVSWVSLVGCGSTDVWHAPMDGISESPNCPELEIARCPVVHELRGAGYDETD